MSTLLEMAEAYEAARTAPDPADKASSIELLERAHGVMAVVAKLQGDGRPDCLDCGDAILPARRKAVENAVRCKPCQDVRDQMEARRRG